MSEDMGRYGVHTISGRLLIGFSGIMALLALAGIVGRVSMGSLSRSATDVIYEASLESQLASQLSTNVAKMIEAGARYLEDRDSASAIAFTSGGGQAHRLQQALSVRPGLAAGEIELLATLDREVSALEAQYALAHQLADERRTDAATTAGKGARGIAVDVLTGIERLSTLRALRLAQNADLFRTRASRQTLLLLLTIVGALFVSALVVFGTVRSVVYPLRWLVAQAQELSNGNLAARTTQDMPGEFVILAAALNQTGESLSRLVSGATTTTEDVATSANDLSAVSEEVAMAASQIAEAMSEISVGAEGQVQQLRTIDDSLQRIRERADGVRRGVGDVTTLAHEIELTADAKRSEVGRALGILLEIRTSVQKASGEVAALDAAAADINRLVAAVSRIAEQTNLLALNAAIEAARAGNAGRGFAVVADEVRKLAAQAEVSATDITRMTSTITTRVASTADAMQAGAASVGEIEHLSRSIDAALGSILAAAGRVREAAHGVTSAAEENTQAVESGVAGLSAIARTAEAHAAAAQEVSASTEEQSAACEEMTSSAGGMLQSATRLRELVRAVRTQVS